MKITFYGAAREVTGSCFCVEVNGKKVLVDCGLQQGEDEKDDQRLPFDASGIDCVVLTHAHIDHSGRLPLLVKEGFRGKIYTIRASCDLVSILLKDSANIQESDAKLENKKRKRAGKGEIVPLYSVSDAEECLKYLVPCSYGEMIEACSGIKINFVDAGHILGSASVEMFINERDISKKIVFSGDIGNMGQPIIRDPQYLDSADYVVMEATYGDRDHEKSDGYETELAGIIDEVLSGGGNVIIPSFAVGRTQGVLYLLREIKEKRLVSDPGFPVYVDSPLASEATRLYGHGLNIYGDPQTKEIIQKGSNPMAFPNLHFTDSTEDSKALNYDMTPKVIISSSGMCEGGRIRHHLKHNLWRNECAVLFVGFQAGGTLGRLIVNGAKAVNIFGEEIAVLAKIHNFTGLSAHADRKGLLKWIGNIQKKPDKIFVTHVEESVSSKFVSLLDETGFSAVAPLYTSSYDLERDDQISQGIDIKKEVFHENPA